MKIKGILFDKDDTLVDIHLFWRRPCALTIERLLADCGCVYSEELFSALNRAVGFSEDGVIPGSPVQSGTNDDLIDACLAILRERHIPLPPGNPAAHEGVFA